MSYLQDLMKAYYENPHVIGPIVNGMTSIADGGTYTIRPEVGKTWLIKFLGCDGGTVTLNWTDGTYSIPVDTFTSAGVIEKAEYWIDNNYYLEMVNASGSTTVLGYFGHEVET